jgi:hypothetical protein
MKYLMKHKYYIFEKNIEWDVWDTQEEPIVPKEFKGHEDFYNFLVDNDVLDKYMENYDEGISGLSLENFLNSAGRPTNYISWAFIWTETNSGHDFWNKLNTKWIEYLKVNESIDWDDWDIQDEDDLEIQNGDIVVLVNKHGALIGHRGPTDTQNPIGANMSVNQLRYDKNHGWIFSWGGMTYKLDNFRKKINDPGPK